MCRDRGNKYFVWAGPKYNQNKCYCKDGYTSSRSYVSIVSGEANSCSGEIGKLGGLSISKGNKTDPCMFVSRTLKMFHIC